MWGSRPETQPRGSSQMDEAVVQRLWRLPPERQGQVLGWKDTRPWTEGVWEVPMWE